MLKAVNDHAETPQKNLEKNVITEKEID